MYCSRLIVMDWHVKNKNCDCFLFGFSFYIYKYKLLTSFTVLSLIVSKFFNSIHLYFYIHIWHKLSRNVKRELCGHLHLSRIRSSVLDFTKFHGITKNLILVENALPSSGRLTTELIKMQWKNSTGQLQPHPPIFFKKVEIFIPLEVYTYVVTACLILLATSTSLHSYVNSSCSGHF